MLFKHHWAAPFFNLTKSNPASLAALSPGNFLSRPRSNRGDGKLMRAAILADGRAWKNWVTGPSLTALTSFASRLHLRR